jgi:hypothetical protein
MASVDTCVYSLSISNALPLRVVVSFISRHCTNADMTQGHFTDSCSSKRAGNEAGAYKSPNMSKSEDIVYFWQIHVFTVSNL